MIFEQLALFYAASCEFYSQVNLKDSWRMPYFAFYDANNLVAQLGLFGYYHPINFLTFLQL
jgi:hypothetical protein